MKSIISPLILIVLLSCAQEERETSYDNTRLDNNRLSLDTVNRRYSYNEKGRYGELFVGEFRGEEHIYIATGNKNQGAMCGPILLKVIERDGNNLTLKSNHSTPVTVIAQYNKYGNVFINPDQDNNTSLSRICGAGATFFGEYEIQ